MDVQFVVLREQGRAIFQKIRLARISRGDNKEVRLARKADQRVIGLLFSPAALWASRTSTKRAVAFVIVRLNAS